MEHVFNFHSDPLVLVIHHYTFSCEFFTVKHTSQICANSDNVLVSTSYPISYTVYTVMS